MVAEPAKFLTLDEYVTLEETSDEKHAYYAGAAFAMTGGMPDHNRIAANIIGSFVQQLRGKPCQPYTSDRSRRSPSGGCN